MLSGGGGVAGPGICSAKIIIVEVGFAFRRVWLRWYWCLGVPKKEGQDGEERLILIKSP